MEESGTRTRFTPADPTSLTMMQFHDQDPRAVTKANVESQPGPNPIISRGKQQDEGFLALLFPKFHLLKSGLEKEVKKMTGYICFPSYYTILSFSEQFRNYEILIIIKPAGRKFLIPDPGYHDQQG